MIIRKCKTKGAFEAIPDKIMQVDFNKIKNRFEVIADLPILVIVKCKNIEVTCYKNGKLIIKTYSEKIAGEIVKEIYDCFI